MKLRLSTRWNAHRHRSGEALVEEILRLGIDRIELGYDLTIELVAGVRAMVERKAVTVDSVHNFCPVPVGVPAGHPELYLLASLDERERSAAVRHIGDTLVFAGEIGARAVVVHAGYVKTWHHTRGLIRLAEDGKRYEPRFERLKMKLLTAREKKVQRYLDALRAGLEELLPVAESNKVRLCIENLPTWEAVPTEAEAERLLTEFNSPHLGYWHDIGHGQIRENLGFIVQTRWIDRLRPWLAGMHIHDVKPPALDHLMPPNGTVDFSFLQPLADTDLIAVLEPAPGTPDTEIAEGIRIISDAFRGTYAHGKEH